LNRLDLVILNPSFPSFVFGRCSGVVAVLFPASIHLSTTHYALPTIHNPRSTIHDDPGDLGDLGDLNNCGCCERSSFEAKPAALTPCFVDVSRAARSVGRKPPGVFAKAPVKLLTDGVLTDTFNQHFQPTPSTDTSRGPGRWLGGAIAPGTCIEWGPAVTKSVTLHEKKAKMYPSGQG
jgi:hypothetical protein